MGHQKFIEFLQELVQSGWYAKPKGYRRMRNDTFLTLSYKHWAIQEMLEEVEELPFFVEPLDFIEDFRHQMDEMACQAKTEQAKKIFSIAYDAATDVLDLWIGGGSK